ncbi:mRNA decay activator protein ZFP36L2-B-like [Arachis ipaensis]|uniref:mRNA decay activator protein ZFP36L2-B-like n=1 Tax=Arachis ipaensis TaxID=130454 RepID=UPI0007AF6455|nr:mRNA decay activator protein ZFP36L2-B-like [Arachis ipaensis]
MEMEMEDLNWKKKGTMSVMGSRYKTELCRRFMAGTCGLGSKCRYAHGLSELRGGCPKVCRMFSQYRNCSYGHTCRFLHSSSPTTTSHFLHHAQPPEYRPMQTTSATNASSSILAIDDDDDDDDDDEPPPCRVKCIFKDHELQRISRIYADWI